MTDSQTNFSYLFELFNHTPESGSDRTVASERQVTTLAMLNKCTLQDQSLALKRKHRVHKYVNTAAIGMIVMILLMLT